MQGRTENSVKNRYKSLIRKQKGNLSQSNPLSPKESEIQCQPSNFNTMLLLSPQIVNYEYADCLNESPHPNFARPIPLVMRSIREKIPSLRKISEIKDNLKKETIIEGTPSPSTFLNLRG